MTEIVAIVTAGGISSRFGSNKLLETIKDKTVLEHSVKIFSDMGYPVIVTANEQYKSTYENILKNFSGVKVVTGGKTRQQSVYNGLKACKNPDIVIIHDAARPLVSKEVILKSIENAKTFGGAVVGIIATDTVKIIDDKGFVNSTADRNFVFLAQTPQTFKFSDILKAHEKFKNENMTDDSALAEACGINVKTVIGNKTNIKITTPEDLIFAREYQM